MDGEAVPLRAQSHEQIAQDGVRSYPGFAAGHVGVALRLIPADGRAHRSKNGRDISPAKRIVEALQKVYVAHALLLGSELLPTCHPAEPPQAPRTNLTPTALGPRSSGS